VLVKNKTLIVKLHSIDQYSRVVASVYVRRFWFFRKNLSLAMVKAGLATVYRAGGAQYGGVKAALESAEAEAQYFQIGKWRIV
jgi:endonuclease YncB( thermonuclease family)